MGLLRSRDNSLQAIIFPSFESSHRFLVYIYSLATSGVLMVNWNRTPSLSVPHRPIVWDLTFKLDSLLLPIVYSVFGGLCSMQEKTRIVTSVTCVLASVCFFFQIFSMGSWGNLGCTWATWAEEGFQGLRCSGWVVYLMSKQQMGAQVLVQMIREEAKAVLDEWYQILSIRNRI